MKQLSLLLLLLSCSYWTLAQNTSMLGKNIKEVKDYMMTQQDLTLLDQRSVKFGDLVTSALIYEADTDTKFSFFFPLVLGSTGPCVFMFINEHPSMYESERKSLNYKYKEIARDLWESNDGSFTVRLVKREEALGGLEIQIVAKN